MHLDVVEIRDFYHGGLGQIVRRQILHHIHDRLRDGSGMTILGIGYTAPYLRPFLNKAKIVTAFCPAEQGGIIWPSEGPARAVLVEEDMFPVYDECFDRIIEVHGLEFFADVKGHLDEVWRVMQAEARFLLIVPNRRGVWARIDTTPFGNGQPFSRGQLRDLLVASRLRPLSIEPLVHFAPFESPFRLSTSAAIERIGAKVWPHFSGMLMVEAIKEVRQPIRAKGVKVGRIKQRQVSAKPVPA